MLLSAAFVLAGGAFHLQLWFDKYRYVPPSVPGWWVPRYGFLADVAGAVAFTVVIVVFARSRPWMLAVAALYQLVDIAVLVASREASIFGWTETGYRNDAREVIALKSAAVVFLVTTLVVHRAARPTSPTTVRRFRVSPCGPGRWRHGR